jgi:hypothetical protein
MIGTADINVAIKQLQSFLEELELVYEEAQKDDVWTRKEIQNLIEVTRQEMSLYEEFLQQGT